MADVKICDRCGKKIEASSRILLRSHLYYCHLFHENFCTRSSYDLCRDCYEDFKHFVYDKEESNG